MTTVDLIQTALQSCDGGNSTENAVMAAEAKLAKTILTDGDMYVALTPREAHKQLIPAGINTLPELKGVEELTKETSRRLLDTVADLLEADFEQGYYLTQGDLLDRHIELLRSLQTLL